MKSITEELFALKDEKYKAFQCALMPTVNPDLIIGVRVPKLRRYAKELFKSGEYREFINELPHKYLEENILHSILINQINDFDMCIYELERFLDYVDNWSVCDTLSCKILCSNYEKFFDYLNSCLKSNSVYKIRFVFVMMMKYFINSDYIDRCNMIALNYKTDEYYINMSIAWYFSYALINEYDKTIFIFEETIFYEYTKNSICTC